jgi:hypothetical protein
VNSIAHGILVELSLLKMLLIYSCPCIVVKIDRVALNVDLRCGFFVSTVRQHETPRQTRESEP